MKNILLLIIITLTSWAVTSQNIPGINYQALVRDINGQAIASQNIQLRVSILKDSTTGTIVYKESHDVATNSFGQLNLSIGEGEVLEGIFNAINWGSAPFFLKTEIDLNGSGTFHELEVVKFYSVPVSRVAGGVPVMTSGGRDAIEEPMAGMQIFNSSRKCIEFFTGTNWTSADAPGSIKPFAGCVDKIPEGWLLCNGDELSTTEKADLFEVIANNWGIAATDMFKLPDLRGVFLRGVNINRDDVFSDPDIELRVPSGDGEKNDVGSFQGDIFGSHTHSYPASNTGCGITWTEAYWALPEVQLTNAIGHCAASSGDFRGGEETRSKNAYVNYIIKY